MGMHMHMSMCMRLPAPLTRSSRVASDAPRDPSDVHLRVLETAGLVSSVRRAGRIIYSLQTSAARAPAARAALRQPLPEEA
jgi:hypothetical protein